MSKVTSQNEEYSSLCYIYGEEFLDFFDKICLPSFVLSIKSASKLEKFFFKFATNSKSKPILKTIVEKHNLRCEFFIIDDLDLPQNFNHINIWDALLQTVETNYVFLLIPDWIFSTEYVATAIENCKQSLNTISYPVYCCKDALLANENLAKRIQNSIDQEKHISNSFIAEIACEYTHPLYFALFEINHLRLKHIHFEASIKEISNNEILFTNNAQHAHVLVISEKRKDINAYLHSNNFNFSIGNAITIDKIDNMFPMILFATRFSNLSHKFKSIYHRETRPNSNFFSKRQRYYFRYNEHFGERTYEIVKKPKTFKEAVADKTNDWVSLIYHQTKLVKQFLLVLISSKYVPRIVSNLLKRLINAPFGTLVYIFQNLFGLLRGYISQTRYPKKQQYLKSNHSSTDNEPVDEASRIVRFSELTIYGWYFNFLPKYEGFLGRKSISHIEKKFAMLANSKDKEYLTKLSKDISEDVFEMIDDKLSIHNAKEKKLSASKLRHIFFINFYRAKNWNIEKT